MRSARSAVSDDARRTNHGAKMTPKAIATTSAASATSVAAASAPVNCRKTIAAAMTSVTPIPMREMTAGRDSAPGAGAASAGAAGSRGAVSAALGGSSLATGAGPPVERCQISAPPAATSASGQTRTSENGSPSSRKASRTASSKSPAPSATSTVPRRPWASIAAIAVSPGAASAGMRIHAST